VEEVFVMPTIRLDDDVFNGLKSLAEPFTDTPNSVIRRLLQDKGAIPMGKGKTESHDATAKRSTIDERAPRRLRVAGLTPQTTYENYLLHVLATQFNGRGDKSEVTKAVIALLQSREPLSQADLERVSTGETKAENTIAWGRNALKERGLIGLSSPRGTWELTEKGMKEGREIKL
jgi:predicted transcriptional regulator